MKHLIICFALAACTSTHTSESNSHQFWSIAEKYNPSWNRNEITSRLGPPQEIRAEGMEKNLIYRSPKTNHQIWSIALTQNDTISGIVYLPEEQLSITDIQNRWKAKKCTHTKETKLTAGHNYQTTRKLVCENGKIVVSYNRYNEVEEIYLK